MGEGPFLSLRVIYKPNHRNLFFFVKTQKIKDGISTTTTWGIGLTSLDELSTPPSELQKAGILGSRIPDISGRESGHFQINATNLSIFGIKIYNNANLRHSSTTNEYK